jgi:hypothetical protein
MQYSQMLLVCVYNVLHVCNTMRTLVHSLPPIFASFRYIAFLFFLIIYLNTVYYGKQPAEDVILTGLVLILVMSVEPGYYIEPIIRFMYS